MIKSRVQRERLVITTRDQLKEALQTAHQKMQTQEWRQYFINLCDSMRHRLAEVIQNNGGPTSY